MPLETNIEVETVAEQEWDALVRQFPKYTAFHMLPWLKAVADANGLSLILIKATRRDHVEAVWPCLSVRKGLLRIIGSPLPGWSTPYLGPLVKNGNSSQVIGAMLQHPELRRGAYFACKALTEDGEVDLRSMNFTSTMQLETYRLDLRRSEDELWSNCRRECRNHIRKAEKSGVEIRVEAQEPIVDDFWSMSLETFGKSGIRPTYSRELIDAIWKRCGRVRVPICDSSQMGSPPNSDSSELGTPSQGCLDVISAFHQGTRIATLFLLHNHHTMYYWGGASRLEFRHIPANNLLQWHAIRMAKQRGLATYDFVGTYGKPGTFKASFGPTPVVIGAMWERSASRLLSSLKRQYERHMRRRQAIRSREPMLSKVLSIPASAASWVQAMLIGH